MDNAPYFQQSSDSTGKIVISPYIKCGYAIRQLSYNTVRDHLDKYMQMGEKTSRDSLNALFKDIMDLYEDGFLRRPTDTDVAKLYASHEEKHGFPRLVRKH
ncbi:hypothetical protein Tco_0375599 [Tanacetum coccineum]